MNLKTVFLLFFCVFLFLLLREISCIANYQNEKNYLTEDDRRGAEKEPDQIKSETHKYYAQSAPQHDRHLYSASDYGTSATSFSSPGYAIYGHQHGHQTYGGYPSATSGHGGGFGFGHSGSGGVGHGGGGHNALALKGLLIPLAGIALLGAAAALSTNPVLLQLGVLNGRKRRSLTQSPNDNNNNNVFVYPTDPHLVPRK